MQMYVAVFAVLAASLVQEGESSKCDLAVLDRIVELYQRSGVPSGLLEKSIRLSPDNIVASTDGYFDNQDDISCISTSWSAAGFISTFSYKSKGLVTGTTTYVEELHGQIYQSEGKIRRYHIPTSGLVSAFYKCEEEGEQGSAEGLVKIWKGYESQSVDAAITDLEYVLGSTLSQRFSNTC